jgi:hypothetical protein
LSWPWPDHGEAVAQRQSPAALVRPASAIAELDRCHHDKAVDKFGCAIYRHGVAERFLGGERADSDQTMPIETSKAAQLRCL